MEDFGWGVKIYSKYTLFYSHKKLWINNISSESLCNKMAQWEDLQYVIRDTKSFSHHDTESQLMRSSFMTFSTCKSSVSASVSYLILFLYYSHRMLMTVHNTFLLKTPKQMYSISQVVWFGLASDIWFTLTSKANIANKQ